MPGTIHLRSHVLRGTRHGAFASLTHRPSATLREIHEMAMRRLTVAMKVYGSWLRRYPCRNQAINTAVLMCAGDVVAQTVVEGRDVARYDATRTGRFLLVGLCLAGPGMHWWYSRLDKLIKSSSHAFITAVKKTAVDQAFFLPFYLAAFISVMAALRLEQAADIRRKLHRDFRPMLVTSLSVWPAVQLINFWAVPLHFRIPVINIVGLFWNTYASWLSERKHNDDVTD